MRNTLFLILAQSKRFWKARTNLLHLRFVGYRTMFRLKHSFREFGTTIRSLLSLLKDIVVILILIPLIAFAFQKLNPWFVPWFTERGFTITKGAYAAVLATFTSLGGLFIGLYYAAISGISAAIYAKLPNNIRDLLAREQVGTAYMHCLVVLTYFGVCLLALYVVGHQPVILAMPLLVLGAGWILLGFVRLGTRAFSLSDPTTLSNRLFDQLRQCYLRIQAGGYRWSDRSFQNHAREIAQSSIDTLTSVSEITAQEQRLNGRPFADLCKNLIVFLYNYEPVKKRIPTESLWYEKQNIHPDWFRTGDTETSLAHQTAMGLKPTRVSDARWIESAILPIVHRCLEINLKDKRYSIVNELLSYLNAYVRRLAEEQQVESAFELINDTFSHCERLIFVNADEDVEEEPLEHMGICEQLAMMPVNVFLAYTHAIKSYGQDAILQRIQHITWNSEKSIYRAGFGVHVLTQLEWLRPRLEFEQRVEGSVISPPLYLQELIAQKEAENLRSTMVCFYQQACNLYKKWMGTATSSHHPWLTAVMIASELEYWNKTDYHMNSLNQLWSILDSDRQIEGLPWPSLDTDTLTNIKTQREKELLRLMAYENNRLSVIPRQESYPDLAGQFLHNIGEALIDAMCENDFDMVEALFRHYFYGGQLKYAQLRPEEGMPAQQIESGIKIAVAPLLDIMDISGYMYLLSDYHDTPSLKEPIVNTWNEYLDQDSVILSLAFVAAAVSLTESALEIAHRSINRTRWSQIIQQRLGDVERREVPLDQDDPFAETETVVAHKSPLVRAFVRDQFELSPDGIDIFIAEYVRKREDGRNLDFGRSRSRYFEEKIRKEENRDTVNE